MYKIISNLESVRMNPIQVNMERFSKGAISAIEIDTLIFRPLSKIDIPIETSTFDVYDKKGIPIIFYLLSSKITPEKVIRFLTADATDADQNNIFHKLALRQKSDVITTYTDVISQVFGKQKVIDMLNAENKYNLTPLACADDSKAILAHFNKYLE
jgi:hypothetical protein